ncbi:GSCOCT00014300001.2-RA-CDS [Cotesia congregata]|uniref:Cc_bv12.1_17.5 n=1 Tax=Cotesia congregata TaxID=51543 RepID=S6D4V0_COTCN|nr:GSCOCT00014300001.2-RA-CDS [Cotesia congregata]CAG5075839.1 cc_bv12.1_17.5 [Cotesia congregata]CCQ71292.1 hypothetical protein BV12-1 [Cotesia congregata]
MSEYQLLTSEIMVPKEWPIKTAKNLITNIAKQAISNHQKGVKISLTVSDVTGLVIDNENGPGYIFKKIEEIHEDTGRIDLLIPVRTDIIMPEPNLLAPTGSHRSEIVSIDVRYDHPISRMLVPKSDRHVVLIAAPIIEEVLEKKGVRGYEMYDYTLRSTYTINNKSYNDVLKQKLSSSSQSGHPSISIERIGTDKWIIVYNDRLSQH